MVIPHWTSGSLLHESRTCNMPIEKIAVNRYSTYIVVAQFAKIVQRAGLEQAGEKHIDEAQARNSVLHGRHVSHVHFSKPHMMCVVKRGPRVDAAPAAPCLLTTTTQATEDAGIRKRLTAYP
jgi:hypothetical protein